MRWNSTNQSINCNSPPSSYPGLSKSLTKVTHENQNSGTEFRLSKDQITNIFCFGSGPIGSRFDGGMYTQYEP
jgi:hypothetical protein